LGALLLAALVPLAATTVQAGLPSSDYTLQTVVTDNLPVFFSLSGYSIGESTAGGPNRDLPLFYPYDNANDDWWDNLVAEQLQARMPVIMCASRGCWTTDRADQTGPGN
jgi:Domain of unknown function (DUF5010)